MSASFQRRRFFFDQRNGGVGNEFGIRDEAIQYFI